MWHKSFRVRLTVWFVAAISLVVLCFCAALAIVSRQGAHKVADRDLDEAVMDLRFTFTRAQSGGRAPDFEEEAPARRLREVSMMAFDSGGRVVYQSEPGLQWSDPAVRNHWAMREINVEGYHILLGWPWGSKMTSIAYRTGTLALLGLIVVACSGIGAWVLIGRILTPIKRLAEEARPVSSALPLRLTSPSHDAEMVELVNTLNALLEEQSKALDERNRFYAAASHELRTPLQALKGHLEVSLMKDRSNAEYRAVLEEALVQGNRLASLVRDVLFLHRLHTQPLPAPESLDLSALCHEAVKAVRNEAAQKDISLNLAESTGQLVSAPPEHLRILLRNLIGNAVTYSPDKGSVFVGVSRDNGLCRVLISNKCAPPTQEALDTHAKPFARDIELSRYNPEGNGLGLSLCSMIAGLHRWNLSVESRPEGVQASFAVPSTGN